MATVATIHLLIDREGDEAVQSILAAATKQLQDMPEVIEVRVNATGGASLLGAHHQQIYRTGSGGRLYDTQTDRPIQGAVYLVPARCSYKKATAGPGGIQLEGVVIEDMYEQHAVPMLRPHELTGEDVPTFFTDTGDVITAARVELSIEQTEGGFNVDRKF